MINALDRENAVKLISEAVESGARLFKACEEIGISKRTFNRWKETDSEYIDKRTFCERPEPANKLTPEEKQEILEVVHSEKYSELPPSQIVPRLADEGRYIASESSFYRVLREANEMIHRIKQTTCKKTNFNTCCNRTKSSLDVGHNVFKWSY